MWFSLIIMLLSFLIHGFVWWRGFFLNCALSCEFCWFIWMLGTKHVVFVKCYVDKWCYLWKNQYLSCNWNWPWNTSTCVWSICGLLAFWLCILCFPFLTRLVIHICFTVFWITFFLRVYSNDVALLLIYDLANLEENYLGDNLLLLWAALFPRYNGYSWVTLAITWFFPLPFSWVSPRCMCVTCFLNCESPSCYHHFPFLFNDTIVIKKFLWSTLVICY